MRRVVSRLIVIYQQTLSPDHGWNRAAHPHGFCRYYPTCSEYTRQAVMRFGVMSGLWLGFRRILRCHPWAAGGIDQLPERP
ncbi:MAG: membrane protein insertion efficiency factor YidD [Candidatus Kerfeldbacteria bacterium]|nr:membrane protein insertion efficiency factor YidD [Candidatus Kerfeldbacteria bacterium]